MANYNKILKSTATYGTNKNYVESKTSSSTSPLTTKGDVYTFSTSGTRLPVGTNGYVLSADSSETTGLKWVAASSANYYLTALTFGTDSKLTGSMQDTTNVTGSAMTTFTPVTTFVTGTKMGGNSSAAGYIQFLEDSSNGSHYTQIAGAASQAGNTTYTLPSAYPASNDYVLVSTTAGVMSWAENSASNYYTSSATFGTDGILTGTIAGGGSNWTGDFNAGLTMSNSSSNLPKISMTNTNADNSSPLLDFIKDSASPAASDDLGGIRFYGDDSGGAQHNFARIDAESPVVTAGSEVGSIKFRTTDGGTDNTGVMILSGSSVGINTDSPLSTRALHVSGRAYFDSDIISESYMQIDKDGTPGLLVGEGGDADIYYDGTNMYINPQRIGSGDLIVNNGNVGIGTTAPNDKLNINTGAGTFDFRDYNLTYSTSLGIRAEGSGYLGLVTEGANDVFISTNGFSNKRLVVKSDGLVGIGTTSPSYKLHVSGAATQEVRVQSSDSGAYSRIQLRSATDGYAQFNMGDSGADAAGGLVYTHSTDTLNIRAANSNIANVTSTGVGIGTTAPDNQSKLEIIGKVYQKLDANGNINYGSGSFAHGSGIGNYTGYYSSIIGFQAGYYISGNAHRNTALGYRAMYGASTGQQSSDNTAIGSSALLDLGAGNFNTAIGSSAGENITGGEHNVNIGYLSGRLTTIGHKNIAIGTEALYDNVHGDFNIGIGSGALYNTTPADGEGKNIAIGTNAGAQNTTGTGNIFIGEQAANDTTWQTLDDKLVIANSATTTPLIHGDFSAKTLDLYGSLELVNGAHTSNPGTNHLWASGSTLYWGSNEIDTSADSGTIAGSLSDNYIPIGTAANTIGDFVLGLAENNSIWIGSDPTATTDTASKNVALGVTALDSITTGDSNVAIGYNAGTAVTTGGYSTYIGDMAGGLVTTTSYNNFIGYQAGYSATGQNQNNAMGYHALYQNAGTNNVAIGHNTMEGETGADNDQTVAVGAYALRNISGSANQNVAVGYGALQGASTGLTGYQNVALGNYAGLNATTGFKNIIVGNEAGYDLTTAQENIIVGDQAGSNILGGSYNVAIGSDAYKTATTGNYNIAIGKNAMQAGLVTSNLNVAIGYDSLKNLTSGDSAVAIGAYALDAMTTANNNTAVGHSAGSGLVDGGANTLVGKEAGLSLTDQTHNTLIGYNAAIYNTGESNVAVGSSALKTGSNDYNVAIGQSAMTKVSGGAGGVAVGYQSGYHPTGNYNTWVGYNAGFGTAAASGYNNVGVGYETLMTITSGLENTAIGYFAGRSITSGPRNTIVGSRAADAIQTVDGVVAIGYAALGAGAGSNYDVAIGYEAHYNGTSRGVFIGLQAGKETTGTGVAIGSEAGETNTTSSLVLIGHDAGKMVSGTAAGMTAIGHSVSTNASGTYHTMVGFQAGNTLKGNVNTGVGYKVLTSGTNATHQNNVAIGYQTMQGGNYSVTNQDNTAIGVNTLRYASGSSYNVAIGNYAMGAQDQEGLQNVAVGYYALSGATGANAVTAVGHLAARDLTTGDSHVAIGKSAMLKVTTTSYNTVVGVDALSDVDGAGSTTAVGFGAMKYSSADNATGIGQYALSGATGDKNAALGNSAGATAKGSANSVMVGYQAGFHPTGNYNVWVGYKAGYGVVDSGAAENVGIGREALLNITSASSNIALGYFAGYSHTTGDDNVFIGVSAGKASTTAAGNVAIGKDAMKIGAQTSSSGGQNTVVGYGGYVDGTGLRNVVLGYRAGYTATSANSNVYIGYEAGAKNTTGDYNVYIGQKSGPSSTSTESSKLYIHNDEGTPLIGGDFAAGTVSIYGTGTAKANLDMLSLTNAVNAADMDGTETSIKFNQWYYDGSSPASEDSGRITVGTLNDWTTSAGTRDSEMSFDISIDGTMYQMGRFNPDGFIIDEYTRLARNTSTNGLYVTDSGGNPVKVATASGSNGGFSLDNTTANTIYRDSGVSMWDSTESYRLQGNTTTGYLQLDLNKMTLVRNASSAASSMFQIGDGGTYDQFSILEDQRGSTATNGYVKLRAKKTGDYGYAKISLGAISGSTTSELLIDSIAANEALRFDTNSKSHAFDIAKAGYVSVGGAVDSTNQFTVVGTTHLSGAATVTGVLSATAKSFNIEHPLYKDKRLVHGSLEGPEHGIYIRGTIEASNGCEIELPEYWSAMCEDYTVQITPHGPYTVFIQEKQKDKVMIASSNKDYKFDYFIVGKRTDETLEVVQDG